MKFAFSEVSLPKRGSLAVSVYADKNLSLTAKVLSTRTAAPASA